MVEANAENLTQLGPKKKWIKIELGSKLGNSGRWPTAIVVGKVAYPYFVLKSMTTAAVFESRLSSFHQFVIGNF